MPTCPLCSVELVANAQFCPKCGQDVSAVTAGARDGKTPAQARREVILGWVLLLAGFAFVFVGLFVRGWGIRALFAAIFGVTLVVCGLGSLTGDDKPKKKRKNRKSDD
jgi:uncharacterized membrane protein YfcA